MNDKLKILSAGQAGFIFETADSCKIGVDLYLSNCCERYFGFKRLMPYLFNPLELDLDLLIATHAHYDHFDPDAVPLILGNNKTEMVCAKDVKAEIERLGLEKYPISYLGEWETFENQFVKITAMPCDHGNETPHAIGILLVANGKKIYIAGDTCYREDYFASDEVKDIDVFIMPINGAFGNMNEAEGAKAASIVNAKLNIPCHYWNFAEHGGNPALFVKEIQEKYPDVKYLVMRPGEEIEL